ncbi:MAG: DUF4783 domain-containing protein [Saprospiraceae bacterium]|nr:DUF4783 domain-containing protein [Saprospiraceae bacterium]
MKTLVVILSLLMPVSFGLPNIAPITKALSEGDATTLSNYLDNSVELTVLASQNVYDKTQATTVLRDFFTKNKPRAFNAVHQGSSKGSASHYTIGDLASSAGNFRVYLYYKSVGDKPVIQEIRIEK